MSEQKVRKGNRPRQPFRRAARPPADRDGPIRLFGLHAVQAALANPSRSLRRLLATDNAVRRLGAAVESRNIAPEPASPRDLDRMLGEDTVHQGVLLEVEPLPEPSLDELVRHAGPGRPLIALDHVTDPHNVGAILRTAAVFDAAGLIMTRRHSPPLNGVLAKSASGALDIVPVHLAQNLARALSDLKALGFEVLGLDGDGTSDLADEGFAGKVALVLGAEGKGLRELTGETCDRLVRIAAAGTLTSLNVSNAAAVALYAISCRRSKPSEAIT